MIIICASLVSLQVRAQLVRILSSHFHLTQSKSKIFKNGNQVTTDNIIGCPGLWINRTANSNGPYNINPFSVDCHNLVPVAPY